jgi:hypothetical protein
MTEPLQLADDISDAIGRMVNAMRGLWSTTEYTPSGSDRAPVRVETISTQGSAFVAETGQPIRGSAGVDVQVRGGGQSYGKPTSARAWVADALVTAMHWNNEKKDPSSGLLRESLATLQERLRTLAERLSQHSALLHQLYQARGYTTYEPAEITELVQRDIEIGSEAVLESIMMSLIDVSTEAIESSGFTPGGNGAFDVFAAMRHMSGTLAEIAGRKEYVYEAIAYLNGPLVNASAGILLGSWSDEADAPVTLAPATDAVLEGAVIERWSGGRLPAGVDRANTVVTFPLRIGTGAALDDFLEAYPFAAAVATKVMDILRIVHGGDLGISGLRIRSVSSHSPTIRTSYAWDYELDAAPFRARRLVYGLPPLVPISADAIAKARQLLPRHFANHEVRGLSVAINRFRDSHERYDPDDPGRLLDIAIALEALLLNDDDGKEQVGYRIRLRGARWLGEGEERSRIFDTLRDLYGLRSRIAHGATVQSLNSRQREELGRVLADAPALLRRALERVLAGSGPPASASQDTLRMWWRHIELS